MRRIRLSCPLPEAGVWPTETLLHDFCSKAFSPLNLNSVKLVSITLGQKWELQYLNTPRPFTCKLNSAPLAETNYSQLLVAGHEWASKCSLHLQWAGEQLEKTNWDGGEFMWQCRVWQFAFFSYWVWHAAALWRMGLGSRSICLEGLTEG